ncbi:MAG: sensor histidine kinase [Bacteroidales bacterium]|nr:MAG: sensor histidine kinase [Bacteroidales bacterium]
MNVNDKNFIVLIIDSESNTLNYKDALKELPQCEFLYSDNYLTQVEPIKQKRFDAILVNIKFLAENKQPDLSLVKKQFKDYSIPTFFFRLKASQEIIIESIINTSITPPDSLLIGDLVLSVKDSNLRRAIVDAQPKLENPPNKTIQKVDLQDNIEINQQKAVFIRNITYEIRTLLNNVGGPIQLIKEKIDDPELIPFFSIIDTTLNRMVEFTFKATLSSDLKLGSYPIKKKLVNLDEIFRFSALELTEYLELEKIKLTVNPTHTSASIYGDKDLLFHSFTAILDKTINLTKENGEIFIDFSLGKDTVDCKITTNRISFNKQDILEIFNSTSIDQEIGLSLAKMVLNVHDGFYWVDITKETGVTIGISFKTSEHE